jgi:hypothetical protein
MGEGERGVMSAGVIWRKKYEKRDNKERENVKENLKKNE